MPNFTQRTKVPNLKKQCFCKKRSEKIFQRMLVSQNEPQLRLKHVVRDRIPCKWEFQHMHKETQNDK